MPLVGVGGWEHPPPPTWRTWPCREGVDPRREESGSPAQCPRPGGDVRPLRASPDLCRGEVVPPARDRGPRCSGTLSVLVCRLRPLMGPPWATTASTCPRQANSPLPKAASAPPGGPTPAGWGDGGGSGGPCRSLHILGVSCLWACGAPWWAATDDAGAREEKTLTSPTEVPPLDPLPCRSRCKGPGVRSDPSQQVGPRPETGAGAAGEGVPRGLWPRTAEVCLVP